MPPRLVTAESLFECHVDFSEWRGLRESGEGTVPGNFPCSLQEAGPGCARERAADADAPHTGVGELLHRGEVTADQHVDGLRCHRAHDGRDVRGAPDAGGKEAVRAGPGVGGEPAYRLGEIGPADDEALAPRREQYAGAAAVDRAPCRLDALERKPRIEQR